MRNENVAFKKRFVPITDCFAVACKSHLEEISKVPKNVRFSNEKIKDLTVLFALTARLGRLEAFSKFEFSELPESLDLVRLLVSILGYQISYSVSEGAKVDLSPLSSLVAKIEAKVNSDQLLLSIATNRLLVSMMRYCPNDPTADDICSRLGGNLSNFLLQRKPLGLQEHFEVAVALRGFSMHRGLSEKIARQCLQRSLELPMEYLENSGNYFAPLLIKELTYTCLLSCSKLARATDDDLDEEKILERMVTVDPYDSTAFSELGLFSLRKEKYTVAFEHFAQAARLGPPAFAMNLFYAAVCLIEVKNYILAIEYLDKSIAADDLALSPLILLFQCYQNTSQFEAALYIRNKILTTEDLRDLLDDSEKIILGVA